MIAFETSGGKKIEMVPAKGTSLFKLQFSPGGELPEELSGMFSAERDAEKAIRVYLAKSKPKKD